MMHKINPYEPTILTPDTTLELHIEDTGVNGWWVFFHSLTGIAISGAAFAFSTFSLLLILDGLSVEFFGRLLIGLVVGFILAGISGTITLSGLFLLSAIHRTVVAGDFQERQNVGWSPFRIKRFAALAGAISGLAAVLVPAGFSLGTVLFALIPAAFGIIGALLGVRGCIRTAKNAIANAEAKTSETFFVDGNVRNDSTAGDSPNVAEGRRSSERSTTSSDRQQTEQ